MTNEVPAAPQPIAKESSVPEPAPQETLPKKPPAKKVLKKKTPAKKPSPKRRAAKKSVARPVQAKRAAKKPAPKKLAVKKQSPKKDAAKKAGAKKPTTKKPSLKNRRAKKQAPPVATSKAQAIRDEIKRLGTKVRGKDVITALAAKGITVAPSQVSTALKAAGFRRVRRGTIAQAGAHTQSGRRPKVAIDLNDLIRTKRLVDQLGGADRLKSVLTVLERLV